MTQLSGFRPVLCLPPDSPSFPSVYGNLTATETAPTSFMPVDDTAAKSSRHGRAQIVVIEMALANLGWGYTKIRDALRTGLKIEIGRTTVANILLEEGIEPAPEREKG
jgi:hypothetical protein